jgi:GH35 family endo-1,4-beta-xylanase
MKRFVKCFVIAGGVSTPALAQTVTTLNGNGLTLESQGPQTTGTSYTLGAGTNVSGITNLDGYIGTYVDLSSAASVTFTVNADGTTSNGLAPDMTLAIADDSQSFTVSSTSSNSYTYTTPTLPTGTYFLRIQLDNQVDNPTASVPQLPTLTVNSVTVSGNGVTVSNNNSETFTTNGVSTSNAISAAQTYINNFRQGQQTITLENGQGHALSSGTQVQVQLVRNAFNLGTGVYDTSESGNFYSQYSWMNPSASTTSATLAQDYQTFLLNNFNTVEPENAGKWGSEESSSTGPVTPNMTYVDQLSNFAEKHDLDVRMHNLIWDSQQPTYVNNLFNSSGVATGTNLATLSSDISNRINYYVSGNNAQSGPANGQPRTLAYQQIDVLNEGLHATTTDNYWASYGASGVANIYSEVANAVKAAGANTQLYINDYSVIQGSSNPANGASDPYANWYLNEAEEINGAGYGKVLGGIGVEAYLPTGNFSAATAQEALQNLAVSGLPTTLSEFAISGTSPTSNTKNTGDLQNILTMLYGDPDATTFDFWDFWQALMANDSFLKNYQGSALLTSTGGETALYSAFLTWAEDNNFVLPGQITPMNLTVGADGQISFNGSYGTYEVIYNGQDYLFTSSPQGNSFVVVVPEPAAGAMLSGSCLLLGRRTRRRAPRAS